MTYFEDNLTALSNKRSWKKEEKRDSQSKKLNVSDNTNSISKIILNRKLISQER